MGYKADKEKRNIRDHNKQYLGLDEFEIILHEAIMDMDLRDYKVDLIAYMHAQCQRYNIDCWSNRDDYAKCIAEWLKLKLR